MCGAPRLAPSIAPAMPTYENAVNANLRFPFRGSSSLTLLALVTLVYRTWAGRRRRSRANKTKRNGPSQKFGRGLIIAPGWITSHGFAVNSPSSAPDSMMRVRNGAVLQNEPEIPANLR